MSPLRVSGWIASVVYKVECNLSLLGQNYSMNGGLMNGGMGDQQMSGQQLQSTYVNMCKSLAVQSSPTIYALSINKLHVFIVQYLLVKTASFRVCCSVSVFKMYNHHFRISSWTDIVKVAVKQVIKNQNNV